MKYNLSVTFCSVLFSSGRLEKKQDAQLSQRDRAAGCVIVFAKSRTLELGDNDLRIL